MFCLLKGWCKMTRHEVSIPALLVCALSSIALIGCASTSGPAPTAPEADLTSEDIRRTPDVPIEKALMAKVPGVWITRTPDGGIAIRLRQSSTISGQPGPLYIVDGFAYEPGPGGSLSSINPYEIESITVLKDPSDTAMYGVRGANGVIVIKMKKAGG